MNELYILRIVPEWGNDSNAIQPVIARSDDCLALFDCGYQGSLPAIEAAFAKHNLSCSELTHVLITHHDHDHVGALAALKRKYPQIQVVADRTEAAFLNGSKPSLRLTQARAVQPALVGDAAARGLAFIQMLQQIESVTVDIVVNSGELLPMCGGCEVIATPGHTAGHTSFYLPSFDTFIAGDAAVLEDGALILANPQYAEDVALAEQSLQTILSLRAKTIVCYHGGVFCR